MVIGLVVTIGLVASGGWNWFANFLTSSASGWAQAVGTVVAIIATARIASRDSRRHEEHEALVAEFTASKVGTALSLFALENERILQEFRKISRFDAASSAFSALLNRLEQCGLDITEEQLFRLAPIPKAAHELVDAIMLHRVTLRMLKIAVDENGALVDSATRRLRAESLAELLGHAVQNAQSSSASLRDYPAKRGVAFVKFDEK